MAKTTIDIALRDLEYATSLAIELLNELDKARAQVRTLKPGEEDGCMIVTPADCLPLNAAVARAFRSCREIEPRR